MAKDNTTTTKFRVDISDLKKGMQEARRQIALANSEFKAASSGMDNWGKSADGIRAKLTQLNSNLDAQKSVLAQYEKTLEDVKKEYGENSKEAQEYQTKLNNQKAVVNGTEKQIKNYSEALKTAEKAEKIAAETGQDATEVFDELSQSAKDAGDSAEKSSGGFTVLKGALADLVADGIRAVGGALKDLVTESSEAYAQFSANTGIATDAMGEYEEAIKNVYKQNFGESLTDVAEKMAKVKEVTGELDASKLEDMTKKAITLEDVFDMDMSETLRGVQSLMTHFGMTSEQAFDYIASGAQNGLNYTDELGDNLSEYSGKFAEAGYSAEEYFQILQNGSDGGAYNLDKVNDAINEVTARLADGTIEDGIGGFSKATQDTFKAWQDGKATQKEVIDSIVADIQNTTGEQEKMNLAALAFGTMAEDGGTKFIQSLTSVGDTYDNVQGKADQLAQTKYDTPMAAISSIGRTLKTELLQPIVDGLMPYLSNLANWVQTNLPVFIEKVKEVGTKIQEWLPILAGIGTAFGVLKIGSIITALISGFTAAGGAAGILATALNGVKLAVAAIGGPVTIIIAIIAGLVAAFVVLWKKSDAFRNFWISLWNNIKALTSKAVSSISKFFIETIPQALDKMVSFLKQLPSKVWTWLLATITKVNTWRSQMIAKAKEAASGFLNNVVNFIKGLPSKVWSFLSNTIAKVATFASNLGSKGREAGQKLLDNVLTGVKSLPEKIKTIGSNVVTGLWNGINDKVSWVVGKVKGFGESVLSGIKDFFGIHSPSKVMEKEVGVNLALGVIKGLNEKEKAVVNSATGIGTKLYNAVVSSTKKTKDYYKKSAAEQSKLIVDAAKTRLSEYEKLHDVSAADEMNYWKKIVSATKKGTKARAEAEKEYRDAKKAYNAEIKAVEDSTLDAAKKRLERYQTYHDMSLSEEVAYWDKIRKTIKKGTDDRLAADKEYLTKKKELTTQLKTLETNYANDVQSVYDDLANDIEAAMKKYDEAVSSRASSITSSLALFKEFEADDAVSKEDLTSNLQSQVEALGEWDTVLTQLSQRTGMSSGLMDELEAMGVSSLETLKALNSMSDEELANYNALYEQKYAIAVERSEKENADLKKQTDADIKLLISNANKKLKELKKTYKANLKELGVTLANESETIGKNSVNGIMKGLQSKSYELYAYVKSMMSSMVAAATSELGIASPSKVFAKEVGQWIPKGVALGIDKNTKSVLASVKNMTSSAVSSAKSGLSTGSGATGSSSSGNVVNNFYQTNNSPKSLSRLEIYRQTKNLLGYAGGGL